MELKRLRQNKTRTVDKKPEEDVLKVKVEDPSSKISFKRFQRYIKWFRDRMIVKEEHGEGISMSQQAAQVVDENRVELCHPDNFFKQGADSASGSNTFMITLIKRDTELIKER